MARARIYAGTSGFSYPEWKGTFYPDKLPQSKFLEFYSERLSTVEINNTFYRFPASRLLEDWHQKTPQEFRFAVKANQGITHKGRLKGTEQLTHDFVARCQLLEEKLGPILFQLPPFLRRDDDRLANFLKLLPEGPRYAMEFRHESWFEDAVFKQLTDAGVGLCVSEGDKLDTPREATGSFCYVRLRKGDYGNEELASWQKWFQEQLREGHDVFVYLKHDVEGSSPEPALQQLMG